MASRNVAFDPYRTALITQGNAVPSSIVPYSLQPASSLRGLSLFDNFDLDGAIDDLLNAGADAVEGAIDNIISGLGGHEEADLIVPTQNRLMQRLGAITQQILVGMNPSVSQLQTFYSDVARLAANFVLFVTDARWSDRRASGQALNTVMPYINGSCGYAVPLGLTAVPTQQDCIAWGGGTIGGDGTNGMLGAISRAIVLAGGSTPGTGGDLPGGGGATPGTGSSSIPWGLVAGLALMVYNYSKGNG